MVSHKIRNRNTACPVRLPCESAHRMNASYHTTEIYAHSYLCPNVHKFI